jgi:hypothetical protein
MYMMTSPVYAITHILPSSCLVVQAQTQIKCSVSFTALYTQVESPFQQEQKLDSLQSAAASLPGPAAAFSAVVLVAVAAAVGVLTGGQSPGMKMIVAARSLEMKYTYKIGAHKEQLACSTDYVCPG